MNRRENQSYDAAFCAHDPPSGPEWDVPIQECALAFFDFEMTGLDPEHDRIIEIAIVRVMSERIVDELTTLVDPGMIVRPDANAVHRIAADALTSAPRFELIEPQVREAFRNAIPIGHGTDLDARFLALEVERCGAESIPFAHRLDTLTLARRAISAPSYSLGVLTEHLGLPARTLHRALDDALSTRALFDRLVVEFGATTPRDLWQVRVGQRESVMVRQGIARAIESFAASGAVCEITLRTPGKQAKSMHARVEDWTPPHVRLFVPDTGHVRVIRADRILRLLPSESRVSDGAKAR